MFCQMAKTKSGTDTAFKNSKHLLEIKLDLKNTLTTIDLNVPYRTRPWIKFQQCVIAC